MFIGGAMVFAEDGINSSLVDASDSVKQAILLL
jgi:hypothetical protein